MSRLLIISLAIKAVLLTEFSALENDELVEVFGEKLYNSEPQFERITNIQTNYFNKSQEIVKLFLGHYNSLKPIAVLIEDTEEAYNDANIFLKRVFEMTPNAKYINFTFFKINSTGMSPLFDVNASKWKNIDYKFKHESSFLGLSEKNGSAAFFAVLNVAVTLPRSSGILMFLNNKVIDEDLVNHVGLLRKKNLRVYVVWGRPYPMISSEVHLLKELCDYTGGLFLPNTEKKMSEYNYRLFLENSKNFNVSTILSRNNLMGPSEFTFPIDSKVTNIHIRISPSIESGSLTTPKGYIIDILENDEIADYSTRSFGVTEPELHEVHLNVATAQTQGVGFWRLKLNNTRDPYNVTVFVFTKLTVRAYFVRKNNSNSENSGSSKNIMKLSLSDQFTSISNVIFVDQNGQPTSDKAKYTLAKDWLVEKEDNASYQNREIDLHVNNVTKQLAYALVEGKDSEGNKFMRLAYLNPYNLNTIFPQETVTIDVGVGSELITTGGTFPVILFEVTNHKATAVDVRFYCRDNKSILRSLQPYRKIISPEETVVVRLTLWAKYGSYQEEVEFTASLGSEAFTKKVLVDVGTQRAYDEIEPELDYTFSSDCSKVIFSQCEQGTWTVKIKARDAGSGLLTVMTVPKGIYFPNGFTSGTKEQVEGYYSGSCCSPDLQIIAVDRMNNRLSRKINAYLAFWGPAQIAALVLGLLILILLIVLIVYLIVKCVKKRKNYDLPTYRGGRI